MKSVADNLVRVLIAEQRKRDGQFEAGNFVETAIQEHPIRYWLEGVLGSIGFTELTREVAYPSQLRESTRKACDLVGKFEKQRWWIEIKVAYSNTTYTVGELIADIERLDAIGRDERRLYVVVFASKTSSVPQKLDAINDAAKLVGASPYIKSKPVPAPASWQGWGQAHLHVLAAAW